jgi:hypothetical protein
VNYLKFLGWTLLAALGIGLAAKLGGPVGLIGALGTTIGIFWRLAPRFMSIAYAAWVLLTVGWLVIINALVRAAPQIVAKHNVDQVHMAEGFWLLVGMLVLHPLCYGIGRLIVRRQG